jgi:cation transport ATPase
MAKVFHSISLPFAGLGVMGYIQGMQVLLGSKALLVQKGVIIESDVISPCCLTQASLFINNTTDS